MEYSSGSALWASLQAGIVEVASTYAPVAAAVIGLLLVEYFSRRIASLRSVGGGLRLAGGVRMGGGGRTVDMAHVAGSGISAANARFAKEQEKAEAERMAAEAGAASEKSERDAGLVAEANDYYLHKNNGLEWES